MVSLADLDKSTGAYKRRLQDGRLALTNATGNANDVVPMAREICGWDNNTTASLVGVFKSLNFPPKPTAAQRAVLVALISPVCHLGLGQLHALGLSVGKKILESARAWVASPSSNFSDGRAANPGRLPAGEPGSVANACIDASYVSSKSNK